MHKYVESAVFKPPKPLLHFPDDFLNNGETDSVSDDCLELYQKTGVPSACAQHKNPKYVFIFFHGNNENIRSCHWFIKDLAEVMSGDVYAIEYKGYFTSKDNPKSAASESACFEDAEKFVDAVKNSTNLPVILVGYSLGCALALHTASVYGKTNDFPHAIMLIAPFVSAASAVLGRGAFSLAFSSIYSYSDVFTMKMSALQQGHDVFVAAGGSDEIIPPIHSQKIAQWCSKFGHSKFLLVPEANHSSIRLYADVYDNFKLFLMEKADRMYKNEKSK